MLSSLGWCQVGLVAGMSIANDFDSALYIELGMGIVSITSHPEEHKTVKVGNFSPHAYVLVSAIYISCTFYLCKPPPIDLLANLVRRLSVARCNKNCKSRFPYKLVSEFDSVAVYC